MKLLEGKIACHGQNLGRLDSGQAAIVVNGSVKCSAPGFEWHEIVGCMGKRVSQSGMTRSEMGF